MGKIAGLTTEIGSFSLNHDHSDHGPSGHTHPACSACPPPPPAGGGCGGSLYSCDHGFEWVDLNHFDQRVEFFVQVGSPTRLPSSSRCARSGNYRQCILSRRWTYTWVHPEAKEPVITRCGQDLPDQPTHTCANCGL